VQNSIYRTGRIALRLCPNRARLTYRANEARLELELKILANTLDPKDEEFEIYCLSKDILSKASLST
jgi:hypothetical protein